MRTFIGFSVSFWLLYHYSQYEGFQYRYQSYPVLKNDVMHPFTQIITFQSPYEKQWPIMSAGLSKYFKQLKNDFKPKPLKASQIA